METNNLNDFTLKAILNKFRDPTASETIDYKYKVYEPGLQIITDFKSGSSNPFSSYEEKIHLEENAQGTLSFKMIFKDSEKINPFISLLTIGRELQLYWENCYYYFVITERKPRFLKDNIEFSFKAQDSCSYFLSKNNVSYNYRDEKDSLNFQYTGKNIGQLAETILKAGHINKRWCLDPELTSNSKYRADFPVTIYGNPNSTTETTATLSLENSNTYNALIELSHIFNGDLKVTYNKNPAGPHILTFANKMYPRLTYHKLRPSVNLNNFNLSENGQNFCTVLHVHGGKDSKENEISIVPLMPRQVATVYGWIMLNGNEEHKNFSTILGPHLKDNVVIDPDLTYYNQNHPESKITYNDEDQKFFSAINKRIPTANSMLVNFKYFLETNQITQTDYNAINNILSTTYRDYNLKLQLSTQGYYNLLYPYNQQEDQEQELILTLAALYEQYINAIIKNKLTENVYVTVKDDKMEIAKDESSATLSTVSLQNYLLTNINDIFTKLTILWSQDYVRIHLLMGSSAFDSEVIERYKEKTNITNTDYNFNFIDAKIIKLELLKEKKIQEYLEKYAKLSRIIQDDNIPVYNHTKNSLIYSQEHVENDKITELRDNNFSAYSQYADLKEDLEAISKYLNKYYQKSISENYTALGYCDSYIKSMQILRAIYSKACEDSSSDTFTDAVNIDFSLAQVQTIKTDFINFISQKQVNYLELIQNYTAARDECWNSLLQEYGRYFIESTFEDTEQINAEGLYAKAYTQLLNYQNPKITYSAEMIDWDSILQDTILPPKVGDKLTIYYDNFNLFNNNLNNVDSYIVVRFETQDYVGAITSLNNIPITVLTNKQQNLFNDARVIKTFLHNGKNYVDVQFNFSAAQTKLVDFSFIKIINFSRVYSSEILCDSNSILLTITGIDKDLRTNHTKLSVNNNLVMNIIVQKMLMSVRY